MHIYVSGTGNDKNPGTLEKPFKKIKKALSIATPGTTVNVMDGIYKERVILPVSGTNDNPITLRNHEGNAPIVDGSGITWAGNWGGLVDLNHKSHWVIEGIHLKNSHAMGFGVGYSESDNVLVRNITIRNCQTTDTKGSGIHVLQGEDVLIDNCTVTRACIGLGHEGISINNTNRFEVKDCEVIDCYKEGIDAKDGSKNGSIHGCTVNGAVRVGIYVDAFSRHSHNIEVYENEVTVPDGTAFAIAVEAGGKLNDVKFLNNVAHNSKRGYQLTSNNDETNLPYKISDITIRNNVAYETGFTGVFVVADIKNLLIENNILFPSNNYRTSGIEIYDLNVTDVNELTIRNNIFRAASTNPKRPMGTSSIVVPDINKVITNPKGLDFRLTEASQAKGAGYNGIDIGAYISDNLPSENELPIEELPRKTELQDIQKQLEELSRRLLDLI